MGNTRSNWNKNQNQKHGNVSDEVVTFFAPIPKVKKSEKNWWEDFTEDITPTPSNGVANPVVSSAVVEDHTRVIAMKKLVEKEADTFSFDVHKPIKPEEAAAVDEYLTDFMPEGQDATWVHQSDRKNRLIKLRLTNFDVIQSYDGAPRWFRIIMLVTSGLITKATQKMLESNSDSVLHDHFIAKYKEVLGMIGLSRGAKRFVEEGKSYYEKHSKDLTF
jgi:hypothetical protein